MKVYADTYNKDVKAYVLYADEDDLLYVDEDCKVGVTADEIFGMFATGILVFAENAYVAATALIPASTSDVFATLEVGEASFYTCEYGTAAAD